MSTTMTKFGVFVVAVLTVASICYVSIQAPSAAGGEAAETAGFTTTAALRRRLMYDPRTVQSKSNDFPLPEFITFPDFKYFISEYIPAKEQVKVVVNVGAQDGKTHDPTYPLLKDLHYQGILFEGDVRLQKLLDQNLHGITPKPKLSLGYVTPESIIPSLEEHGAPKVFDALKVDIDSFDAQLVDIILSAGYQPQVIMVEFNPDIPPPIAWHQMQSNYFDFGKKTFMGNYGASAGAWFDILTTKHGYGIAGLELEDLSQGPCARCEHNLWFVRNSRLEQKQKRVATLSDMISLFWEAQFGAQFLSCIHARSPCPLHHFLTGGDGNTPTEKAIALSNWMTKDDAIANDAAQGVLKTIQDQLHGVCGTPEDGDLCRDEAKILIRNE